MPIDLFSTEHVISTTADLPSSLLAADADGDGDLDVISASGYGGEIAWYENTDGGAGRDRKGAVGRFGVRGPSGRNAIIH